MVFDPYTRLQQRKAGMVLSGEPRRKTSIGERSLEEASDSGSE
jgi:hypothetical protein